MRRSAAETKAKILVAARERFGVHGYERATVRAIGGDAGVDPSMVIRYFGSKELLFAMAADFDLRIPDLSAFSPDEAGTALATHFMNHWESDEGLMLLLRASGTHEAAAERMRTIFAEQAGPMLAKLPGDPALIPVRAGLVGSQVLGMALCRYVLRLPPIVSMTRDEVIAWLGPTLQRYLTGTP